jgi:hypothetical protein
MKSSIFWDIMPGKSTESQPVFQRNISPPPAFMLVSWSAYSSTLKMEATCSPKMSGDFQWTIWHYIPEERTFHNHHCDNLKSYKLKDIQNNSI